VQDLLRRAAEGDAVRIGRHKIGPSVTLDALILVPRPVQFVAGRRDCVCGFLRSLAHLIELRASHAHVIGLNGQDAGSRLNELLLFQDGRCSCVGRDADILEEHAAEEEVHVIGERIELRKPGPLGCSCKTGFEVDCRPADCLVAQRLAVEPHVRQLVLRQLVCELPDRFALEIDLTSSFNVAGIGAGIGGIDALPGRSVQVILCLHVLEIERKLEDVLVLDL
jgi:hypothetical protein